MKLSATIQRDNIDGRLAILEKFSSDERHGTEKRQGLLGNILNGGVSFIGGILNPTPRTSSTQAPQQTSAPPVVITTQEPPVQAPPATTQPPAKNPPPQTSVQQPAPSPSSLPPQTTINNTPPIPTTQPPPSFLTPTSVPPPQTTQIPHIPAQSLISLNPSSSRSTFQLTLTPFPPVSLSTDVPNSILPERQSTLLSSLPGLRTDVPSTFSTSTSSTPTTTKSIDGDVNLSTLNPIMDGTGGASGRGNMPIMTIIISIVVIIFGSILILSLAFFISSRYIKRRKITIAFQLPSPVETTPLNPTSSPEMSSNSKRTTIIMGTNPFPPPSGPLPPTPVSRGNYDGSVRSGSSIGSRFRERIRVVRFVGRPGARNRKGGGEEMSERLVG